MKSISVNGDRITPSKILCIGRNYVEHIAELGNEVPEHMVVFNKPNSAISQQLMSFHQEPLHYEAELCFLIENGQYAAVGFGLDLTKRGLQSHLKSKGLPWERAKAFDQSAVFTEFVRLDPNDDIESLSFSLLINGTVIQQGNVPLMMYKPDAILQELKTYTQLIDGDVVMTGTPKGVGQIEQGAEFEGRIFLNGDCLVKQSWQAL